MKKRIIPVIVIAAVIIAAVVWAKLYHPENPNTILLSGNIELTEVDISFKVAGKLIERTVDEGDPVHPGEILARLDASQPVSQRNRDVASVAVADAQLEQAATAVALQRTTLTDDIALKQAQLAEAQAKLAELLAGSRKQEIEQAQAAAAEARSHYVQASQDWTRAKTLYKNDDISTAQFDQYREHFRSTGASLRQAEEHFALVKEGPRKEEIAQARAAVAQAQAALRLSEANRLQVKQREEDLAARRAAIQQSKAQLAIAESQLGDMTSVSPVEGVVLVKSADVGEVLAAGTTVVTVGDLDHPWLRGYIREQDLGRVKLGQKVKLTTDSYPGKIYWGRVSFIASEAEFTPKQIQTKEERVKLVYRIKIDVANPQHELKSNMPVDAEILL